VTSVDSSLTTRRGHFLNIPLSKRRLHSCPPPPAHKKAVMSVLHRCNLRVVQTFCCYFDHLVFLGTYRCFVIWFVTLQSGGPDRSVGKAIELWAGRSGIESRWGRDFPPVQTGPGAHLASCKMGTGSVLGVKCGREVLLTTHHLLVGRPWKSRAIPLPTLWATPGL